MTEGMIKRDNLPDESRNLDGLFHALRTQQRALDQVLKSVKVPLHVLLRDHDLNRIHTVEYEPQPTSKRPHTWVSSKEAWKALSSICMPNLILVCSTCLSLRLTASSTELALKPKQSDL